MVEYFEHPIGLLKNKRGINLGENFFIGLALAVWPVKCLKSCPKMISPEKLKILTHLQKLPKNVGDLGKLIVA